MGNLDKTRETQAGDFLASVSHELRTPLNAVLGMLELTIAAPLAPEQREYLTSALRSARSLAISLEELCDLAYIESDAFTFDQTEVDLPAIVWRSIRSLRLPARERGVSLSVSIDPNTPQHVLGDAWRLQQVITGLAQHAIQNAASTQLNVELSAVGQHADGVELLLAVHDAGSSPATTLPLPGGASQLHSARYSTAGLALMIARRLAERMDGHLWIDGPELLGDGRTSCLFRLPVAAEQSASPSAPSFASGYGASNYGTASGYGSQPFDDEEVDDHPTSMDRTTEPLRVLVVDDTPANRQVVKAILEKRGHQVHLAANGLQAVEQVRHQPFDVVLMDAQMPLMNGLEATEAIRQLPNADLAKVPIIAMTAHALREDRERCLAAGMTDYLPKPVGVVELLERVERLGHARPTAELPSAGSLDPNPPPHAAQTMLRRFGGDHTLLVSLIGLFRDGLPELQAGLSEGLAEGDAEGVGRAAHNLRGVAANFDDTPVNNQLKEIEQLARDGNLSAVAPLLEPLQASLAALVARLERMSEHFQSGEQPGL